MILFIGFIFTIPLLSAFNIGVPNDEVFRQTENRNKTSLQEWNWDKIALKSNFSQMDNFISDRLTFRYSFVKMSHIIQDQSIENEKRVIVGKNGWLFLGNDYNQTINQYRGIKQLKEKELKNWFSFFENIDAYLANQKIPLYILIPPDKHRIYPEFLPDHLSKKGISPYEQILAKNKNLQIIDLLNTLQKKNKKSEHLLYYKTDSHWNFYGAYLAYQKLMVLFNNIVG